MILRTLIKFFIMSCARNFPKMVLNAFLIPAKKILSSCSKNSDKVSVEMLRISRKRK